MKKGMLRLGTSLYVNRETAPSFSNALSWNTTKTASKTLPCSSLMKKAACKNGHAKAIRMALLDALCRELDCQPGELLVWEPDDAAEKE